jgi:hypothetical protein
MVRKLRRLYLFTNLVGRDSNQRRQVIVRPGETCGSSGSEAKRPSVCNNIRSLVNMLP